jgi:formyltetrahydrofolate deformylase
VGLPGCSRHTVLCDERVAPSPKGPTAVSRSILTLRCQDQPGIVHAVAGALLGYGANIVESAQFSDDVTGLFCMRISFDCDVEDLEAMRAGVSGALAHLSGTVQIHDTDERPRVLVLVSKFDHCLLDLLYRWRTGDLPVEIVAVVSNHDDLREAVEAYGVPYEWVPVTPESKPEAEQALLGLVDSYRAELVVLARYMQVLSDDACAALGGRAINIHHSFLPGFKGARPYHQAHTRGVKLIGATAHYVTSDLDEGPIIEQDVVRVTHAQTADQLAAMGRDVERRVLSHAVRLHAERRVFLTNGRTVVFP